MGTMRAKLFIIAVLAASQFVVRVASTTEESTTAPSITLQQSASESYTAYQQQSHLDDSSIRDKHSSPPKENDQVDASSVQPDRETQRKIEKNLLTLFGMSKRPKPIDRSKIVIPDAMKMLYAEIMGQELRESVNLPKPGLLTKSANTVRSFTHEGDYQIKIVNFF